MKILVLDNYDSFTYNLVHIVSELGYKNLKVYRNDKIALEKIADYDKILLSPGPGIPSEAGIMLDLIKTYGPQKSILGVCLGFQGICEVYGAKLFNMPIVAHGLSLKTIIEKKKEPLFKGIKKEFLSGRYHSWGVEKKTLPKELVSIAKSNENLVMGVKHKKYKIYGVQFHPESILTEHGKKIMENWLNL